MPVLVMCLSAALFWISVGHAESPAAHRRILVLYWGSKDHPANVRFDQSFKSVLQSAPAGSVETYSEYLDSTRFPGQNQAALLQDYLSRKYANLTIDVMVAVSDVTLDFLVKYRKTLFPQTPIVFSSVKLPTAQELAEGPGMTGVVHVDNHRKTLDIALGLQPTTQQVFVVSGTVEQDKRFEKLAREQLSGYENRVPITYLTDVPLGELLQRSKTLPDRSIILYVWQHSHNESGKLLETMDVFKLIAASARVPVYGLSTSHLGNGIVGGYLSVVEARGTRAAEMALMVANGSRPQTIPVESSASLPMFDYRQLTRWGINEESLPSGSIVRFKEPSLWETHKWRIVGAFAVIGAQALLTTFLLIERRKRRQATAEVRKSEEHFRLLFENSRDAILIGDDNGRCLQANHAASQLLGYPHEQLLEKKIFDLVAPDVPDSKNRHRSYLDNGFEKGEFSFARPDGENRTSLYNISRFAPGRHLTILRDITERTQSEESLRQAFAEIKELKEQLQAENVYLKEEIKLEHHFDEIIGTSNELKYVLFKVEQVAPTDTTVLLLGETGTGKELVARAIHRQSQRRDKPLVKVNCATLPATLIESELFGYEKGAFTGAAARKIGRFELANEGTLLLDEIGDLPLELQAKLLRVLQEGEFERLGGSATIKVNVRIIAATNRNLKVEVRNGFFREDLWYRLNIFPISLPPLRNRKDDIPLLVKHFSKIFSKKMGKPLQSIAPGALKALQDYSWPGNVRELANVIERAVINAQGPVLYLADSLDAARRESHPATNGKSLVELEREIIVERLEETFWKIEGPKGAAQSLGLNPSTLRSRMLKLGILTRRDN